jgi:uncharacterized membrane protein
MDGHLSYLIFLRLLHICCGVFWAGATIYLAAFILPASNKAGPEGGKFMQALAQTNKLPIVMMIIPIITVLCGLFLIWEVSNGLMMDWITSTHGIVLITGASVALFTFVFGFAVNRPTVMKMAKIGGEIARAGVPPTAEQAQQLEKLRNRLKSATNFAAILLGFTVIAMSMVHYL